MRELRKSTNFLRWVPAECVLCRLDADLGWFCGISWEFARMQPWDYVISCTNLQPDGGGSEMQPRLGTTGSEPLFAEMWLLSMQRYLGWRSCYEIWNVRGIWSNILRPRIWPWSCVESKYSVKEVGSMHLGQQDWEVKLRLFSVISVIIDFPPFTNYTYQS